MTPRSLVSFITMFAISSAAIAGEKEDQLIANLTQAYGGEALTNLKSYSIEDHFLSPTIGQSHDPSLVEISRSKGILSVDISNNRATYDNWSEGRSGGFQNSIISDGDKAYTINYQANTYGEAQSADPHVFAGGTMRTSDTILAYELNQAKDKAVLKGDVSYMNRPHHVLTMPFPSSSDLDLYIDAETFLISKMVRENPNLGSLEYVYSGHTPIDGLISSTAINFFIGGQPNIISTKHSVSFNRGLDASDVSLASNLKPEGERTDGATMTANKISDNVYHVGQNGGYSLFADTSLGLIGVGGYAALTNRLKHFREKSDNFQPLAYQVVTHHHSDHIGGLGEAVALGAKLVTVENNIETIRESITPPPSNASFYTTGPRTTLGRGRNRVEVYEVTTSHAASFLVTYIPAEKMIFIADHFGTPFATAIPTANTNTVDMLAALDRLEIDIDKIATAHNPRIFSMKELRTSVKGFRKSVCSGNRPVCS